MWDVIDASLREMSPHLALAEPLFRHALGQGYLSFVFDGFDELCGHDPFDPMLVLEELAAIASESEARILLTTRTLFWNARLSGVPENVYVWHMDAFNTQQARGYLRGVFGERTTKNNVAQDLYGQLLRESSTPAQHTGFVRAQFVNLPLCVRMLADFVENDGTSINSDEEDVPVLQKILLAICEREIARQGLVTPVGNQLESFRDVAVTYHDEINPQFELDDLFLSVRGFEARDLEKVADHALLIQTYGTAGEGRYCFRYDFLGPHLRAVTVAHWIVDTGQDVGPSEDARRIMESEAEGKGHVLEQVAMFLAPQDAGQTMAKCRWLATRSERASSFLFHVAQALLRRDPEVRTGRDRTRALCSSTKQVEARTFRGLIDGLDLRGVTFVGCKFISVIFRNCTADGTTLFTECGFEGDLRFERGSGWRRVDVRGCQMRYPTDAVWEDVLGRETVDQAARVEELLRTGLRKFWRHGRVKKYLRIGEWKKGALGRFGEAERVLEEMLRVALVERAGIRGTDEGGVGFDKASIRDLQNYMDNQQKSGKIRLVYERLLENMRR